MTGACVPELSVLHQPLSGVGDLAQLLTGSHIDATTTSRA
jgi:hypothetical protein